MARRHVPDWLVVRAAALWDVAPHLGTALRHLVRWAGEPEKVVERAMERSQRKGYLDDDFSARVAILTPAGRALLAETHLWPIPNTLPIPPRIATEPAP